MVKVLIGRQWWWSSVLVLAAVGVMVRLGLWQLDRLDARRAFNARVAAQQAQPGLPLNSQHLPADLDQMEYRSVRVVGEYDHAQEVALRNQALDGRPGVHLLTPLRLAGSDWAVMVDRGWIPQAEAAPDAWTKFAEPGTVEVSGVIRRSQTRPDFGGVPDPAGVLLAWNLVNLERIADQVSHPLLPIYVQQAPDPAWSGLPLRTQPKLDLSEGSHFGYAMQWFLFAAVLGIGYPRYVLHSLRSRARAPRLMVAQKESD